MELWPFLVSRNRSIGYATVLAPAPWVDSGIADSLAILAGGEQTAIGSAIYREVIDTKIGDFSLIFRVIDAIEGDREFLDGFGRLIEWIEGVVIEGRDTEEFAKLIDFEAIHEITLLAYLHFWEQSTTPPILKSVPLKQSEVSTKLVLNKVSPYIYTKESKKVDDFEVHATQNQYLSEQSKKSNWTIIEEIDFKHSVDYLFNNPSYKEVVIMGGNASYLGLLNLKTAEIDTIRLLNERDTGALAVCPTGNQFAIAVNYRPYKIRPSIIVLWDRPLRSNRASIELHTSNEISCLIYNRNGTLLVCGTKGGDVRIWDAKKKIFVGDVENFKSKITQILFSRDETMLMLRTSTETYICELKMPHIVKYKIIETEENFSVMTSQTDSNKIIFGSEESRVYTYDLEKDTLHELVALDSHRVDMLHLSPNGRLLAIGTSQNLYLLDLETNIISEVYNATNSGIKSLLFTENNKLLSGFSDGKIIGFGYSH